MIYSEENFIDQLGETVEFGNGHICNAKVSQKPGKWVDIAVQTKKNGNTVHARLQFTSEVVAREVVEELDDMLVANIKMLCSSGEKILKPAPCGTIEQRHDLSHRSIEITKLITRDETQFWSISRGGGRCSAGMADRL